MHLVRLAYAAQFLLALIAVFVLWSEVGGQGHLDLVPWYIKLALGGGAAFAAVKATRHTVDSERSWNGKTLRWLGILAVLLAGCGLASYYAHLYLEDDEDDQQDESALSLPAPPAISTAAKLIHAARRWTNGPASRIDASRMAETGIIPPSLTPVTACITADARQPHSLHTGLPPSWHGVTRVSRSADRQVVSRAKVHSAGEWGGSR